MEPQFPYNTVQLSDFHALQTLLGGQTFAWHQVGNWFYGVHGDFAFAVSYDRGNLYWQTFPENNRFDLIQAYFRLQDDYIHIVDEIKKDQHVAASIKAFPGLRLLRQSFEDATISFVISQNSNIPKIRRSIRLLREMYGEKVYIGDDVISLFPTFSRLDQLTEEELRATGIGYRAKYLKEIAKALVSNDCCQNITELTYDDARSELIQLTGVGDKVAGCILVFGLGFDHITPLDVWAKRVLTDLYNLDLSMKYDQMLAWLYDKFGDKTAWAGQFLFEYIRSR